MGRLDDKVCIITGGTKGIGLSTAELFAKEGAKVIACGRHDKQFANPNIEYFKFDATNSNDASLLLEHALEKFGKVDVLVANAGITKDSMTYKMTEEMFDTVINTNLKGIFNIVKVIGPYMERNGGGSIIATSSVVGQYGNIGQANYAASKSGIVGMCKSWAKEFARKGVPVRVNVVSPGYILTDMLKTVPEDLLNKFSSQTMLKRLGQPEEIANAILFLASDDSSYVTGTVLHVDGGMRL